MMAFTQPTRLAGVSVQRWLQFAAFALVGLAACGQPVFAQGSGTVLKADDPLARAMLEMRAAGETLGGDEDLDDTIAAQQRAIEALDELLDQLNQPQASPPPPPSGSPQSSDSQQDSADDAEKNSPSADQSQQNPPQPSEQPRPGAQNVPVESRSDDAANSSERSDPGRSGADAVETRHNLLHDVWGHLPPTVRQRLLNTASERILPQYEQAVREYYESLGESRSRR